MESPASTFKTLIDSAETYASTRIELGKLRMLEAGTNIATRAIVKFVVFTTAVMFIVFVNLGLALYIGDLLGKPYLGFFIISCFYLVLAIVLHFLLLAWIKKPLSEFIITQIMRYDHERN